MRNRPDGCLLSYFALALIDACIIGAVAVSLSTACAIRDVLSLRHSLHRKPNQAKGFYGVYCGLIVMAAAWNKFHECQPPCA